MKLAAIAGTYNDGVVLRIPLRKDGFVLHQYLYSKDAKGKQLFSIPHEHRVAQIAFGAAVLPVSAFDKAFTYLLHYPYGCTEQLMSSLYPIASALQLQQHGFLSSKYIGEDGSLKLQDQGWREQADKTPQEAIYDGINQMLEHQQPDGGFAYWESGESVYPLSAYVYGGLQIFARLGYDIPLHVLESLESYLRSASSDEVSYLYYLRQTTQAGRASFGVEDVLAKVDTQNQYTVVLAYAALLGIDAQEDAAALAELIDVDALPEVEAQYGVYMDKLIVETIYMRALLHNNEVQKAQTLLSHILQQRDRQGMRGWSTQRNVQVLLAIGEYLQTVAADQSEFSCKIKIGNQSTELLSTNGSISWTQ
ncbi:MAG: hypothetical protein H6765_03800 [Candidatus Peribacteria bacterium]|nr:MAG: hypothetical protein H6765_03800 [Candidatus Peribacteria bacterium]